MGNKTNHAEPMVPEEILRRSEAFDILPELQRIKDANLSAEETLAQQINAALSGYNAAMSFTQPNREAIMRLALEMILAQCNCYTEHRAHIVDPIRRTAQQALRECGNVG
jgi:hypothetical protein